MCIFTDTKQLRPSNKELNRQLVEGKNLDEYALSTSKPSNPGGPGSQWRMMKLRRVYETAQEEGREVEDVALERYDNLEAFREAQEEQRLLNEQKPVQAKRHVPTSSSIRQTEENYPGSRLLFNHPELSISRSTSRSSFRKPGSSLSSSPSPSPSTSSGKLSTPSKNVAKDRRHPLSQVHAHIPRVSSPLPPPNGRLSPSSLNRLQAKALKAKLLDLPSAEALNQEYERQRSLADGQVSSKSPSTTKVEVLPATDFHGRLYDLGVGTKASATQVGGHLSSYILWRVI